MKEQQYKRACQIKDRLSELADVKRQIEGTSSHRLYFAYKDSGGDFRCCPDWAMRDISEILDKHDLMIRQEIEEEIYKKRVNPDIYLIEKDDPILGRIEILRSSRCTARRTRTGIMWTGSWSSM